MRLRPGAVTYIGETRAHGTTMDVLIPAAKLRRAHRAKGDLVEVRVKKLGDAAHPAPVEPVIFLTTIQTDGAAYIFNVSKKVARAGGVDVGDRLWIAL